VAGKQGLGLDLGCIQGVDFVTYKYHTIGVFDVGQGVVAVLFLVPIYRRQCYFIFPTCFISYSYLKLQRLSGTFCVFYPYIGVLLEDRPYIYHNRHYKDSSLIELISRRISQASIGLT
jgi:hypothetical protein